MWILPNLLVRNDSYEVSSVTKRCGKSKGKAKNKEAAKTGWRGADRFIQFQISSNLKIGKKSGLSLASHQAGMNISIFRLARFGQLLVSKLV